MKHPIAQANSANTTRC